jgi:hypothetical protein
MGFRRIFGKHKRFDSINIALSLKRISYDRQNVVVPMKWSSRLNRSATLGRFTLKQSLFFVHFALATNKMYKKRSGE